MPRTTLTKKKVFYAAIDAFAAKNYKLCTMQELAAIVGIKAPSLYKHFESKEEILQEIMEYYKVNFNKYRTPIDSIVEAARVESADKILSMMFYKFGTQNEYSRMIKITRIIMDMKFENADAGKLYNIVTIEEPREYLEMVFEKLIEEKVVAPFDYKPLVFQMMAFAHMLLVMSVSGEASRKQRDQMYDDGIQLLSQGFINLEILPDRRKACLA